MRVAGPCETGNSTSVGGLSTTREVMLRETVMELRLSVAKNLGLQIVGGLSTDQDEQGLDVSVTKNSQSVGGLSARGEVRGAGHCETENSSSVGGLSIIRKMWETVHCELENSKIV